MHGAGWTLCFEMFFYLAFGLVLPFRRGIALVVLVLILALLAASRLLFDSAGTGLETVSNPLLLEFAAGILLALAYRRGWRLAPGLAWPLLVVAVAVIAISGQFEAVQDKYAPLRVLWWGLPAVAIVWAVVSLGSRQQFRPLHALLAIGDSSYSLYMLHVLILPAFGKAWRWAGWQHHLPETAFLLSAMGLCVGVSWLVYLWLERPVTVWLRDKWEAARA